MRVKKLPDVTIGSDVVIGDGSPARIIRKITDEDRKRCWDYRR
jgi:acetyltransferase-like isoleucine patch superfamily enzyme